MPFSEFLAAVTRRVQSPKNPRLREMVKIGDRKTEFWPNLAEGCIEKVFAQSPMGFDILCEAS